MLKHFIATKMTFFYIRFGYQLVVSMNVSALFSSVYAEWVEKEFIFDDNCVHLRYVRIYAEKISSKMKIFQSLKILVF